MEKSRLLDAPRRRTAKLEGGSTPEWCASACTWFRVGLGLGLGLGLELGLGLGLGLARAPQRSMRSSRLGAARARFGRWAEARR